MTDIMAGTMLMIVYSLVGFALLTLCAWVVDKTYPEQEHTVQGTQTTNQPITAITIHNGSATRRSNRTNRAA